MVIIFYTPMLGTLLLYNYGIWQNYWVLTFAIGGLWHAGSYDPQDFLGRLIGDKPWVRNAEHSMYECYDDNFFATDFHINMFAESFREIMVEHEPIRVGWPMEYLANSIRTI